MREKHTRLWLVLLVAILAFLAIKAGVLSPPRTTPGGEDGAAQKTMAQKNPAVKVTALDWAKVLEVAKQNATRMGVAD